jgi:hypothetical protein
MPTSKTPCPKGSLQACKALCTDPGRAETCVQSCGVICPDDESEADDSLSGGTIAGLVVGSVVGVGLFAGAAATMMRTASSNAESTKQPLLDQ